VPRTVEMPAESTLSAEINIELSLTNRNDVSSGESSSEVRTQKITLFEDNHDNETLPLMQAAPSDSDKNDTCCCILS